LAVTGRFVLEPLHQAEVRAAVPGMVTAVYTSEGQKIAQGAPLLQLRNVPLQSAVARVGADYDTATYRATSAVLHFGAVGTTALDRDRLLSERNELAKLAANLDVVSPISGTVLTPRLSDRLGSYVKEGTDLLDVADLSVMRARIFVSEYDLYKCKVGAPARVQIDGIWGIQNAVAGSITSASREIDPSLTEANKLKGLNPPNFYLVDLLLQNPDDALMPGSTGTARIYGQKRSIAALAWENVSHFFARKIW